MQIVRVDWSGPPELRFLLDWAFASHRCGEIELSAAYARAAEAVVKAALPAYSEDIARIASRKGEGAEIAMRLIPALDPLWAAAVVTVLTVRGARRPVVDAIREAFAHDPAFSATVRTLCAGALGLTAAPIPDGNTMPISIEVASPRAR